MRSGRFFSLILSLILIVTASSMTAGCLADSDHDILWDAADEAIAAHRNSLDSYLLVYTIGVDLWNIELSGETVNTRTLRTQVQREEAFIRELEAKHLAMTRHVSAFSDYTMQMEGSRKEWAEEVAWDLRLYDEEMWTAQVALKGRLGSMHQYLDLADQGAYASDEAMMYLENANELSGDAAGAIARADAAYARASSRYAEGHFPKIHLV